MTTQRDTSARNACPPRPAANPRLAGGVRIAATLLALVLLGLGLASADTLSQPAATLDTLAADAPVTHFRDWLPALWFSLSDPTLIWVGVVVILMLTLQASPLISLRNIDAVLLASAALALALRASETPIIVAGASRSAQWLSYMWLTLVAVYFTLRGLSLLRVGAVCGAPLSMSGPAVGVLTLALVVLAFVRVASSPLDPSSRDGLSGGIVLADSGKLPYGQVDSAPGSPLLYALHAATWKLAPIEPLPMLPPGAARGAAAGAYATIDFGALLDERPLKLANYVLLTLLLAGLYVAGQRLHSTVMGLSLICLVCAFPGATEAFSKPAVMLPAALLTWSISLALMPGVGGLLSTLLMIAAALAWPWAWLALPAMVCYFLRRRWEGVGSLVGLALGLGACFYYLPTLVAPSLPRAAGALAAAGEAPLYAASVDAEARVNLRPLESASTQPATWRARAWATLLGSERGVMLRNESLPDGVEFPRGVSEAAYLQLAPDEDARRLLLPAYRQAVAGLSRTSQTLVSLRTLLESTWLHVAPTPDVPGAWAYWAANSSINPDRWDNIRRGVKLSVGLLTIAAVLVFVLGKPAGPQNLIGALLMVLSAAMLASEGGATANWALLWPALAAALTFERLITPRRPPASAAPNVGGERLSALRNDAGLSTRGTSATSTHSSAPPHASAASASYSVAPAAAPASAAGSQASSHPPVTAFPPRPPASSRGGSRLFSGPGPRISVE